MTKRAGEENPSEPQDAGNGFTQWLAALARDRRALKKRRAKLDQRVQRGEISPRTRARTLRAARWQARRRRGDSWPKRWLKRICVQVVLPLAGLATLVVGSVEIGPAYTAAHGHGTPGYFTALRTDECKHPPSCSWRGDFISANGQDVRRNVQLDGTWTGVGIGTRIPARDSGDPFAVFPQTGSGRWHDDIVYLALGALIIVPWLLWFMPGRPLRRIRVFGPWR